MIRELSAHKQLLRALGVMATAALSICVLLSSALVHGGGSSSSDWLQFSAFTLFALALILCLPALMLMLEFAQVVRGEQRWWQRILGWSGAEIKTLTSACPNSIKIAAWAVAALAVVQSLRFAYVVHGQLLGSHSLLGVLAGASFFLGLSLPVLLAAAFLKQDFEKEFGRNRRAAAPAEQPISPAR